MGIVEADHTVRGNNEMGERQEHDEEEQDEPEKPAHPFPPDLVYIV
jgi:hypothetical protein